MMVVFLVLTIIIFGLILPYWAGVIAKRKGKSFVLWCILQVLFLFPIVLIAFHSPVEKEK
jgi:NhaP-type Na+/H+ or K+/H+ antiporter